MNALMENDWVLIHYNEACKHCGVPADLHRNADAPPETMPHSVYGWLTCRNFERCTPPMAAYGVLEE